MSRITSRFLAVALVGSALVLGGYGASQATSAPAPTAHVSSSTKATLPTTVSIRGFAFHVLRSVRRGHTVRVVNHDGTSHSVTRNGGGFSVIVPAHSARTFRAPATTGSYRFHCKFHSDMHGTLRVLR